MSSVKYLSSLRYRGDNGTPLGRECGKEGLRGSSTAPLMGFVPYMKLPSLNSAMRLSFIVHSSSINGRAYQFSRPTTLPPIPCIVQSRTCQICAHPKQPSTYNCIGDQSRHTVRRRVFARRTSSSAVYTPRIPVESVCRACAKHGLTLINFANNGVAFGDSSTSSASALPCCLS